jgi:hypothetical protein
MVHFIVKLGLKISGRFKLIFCIQLNSFLSDLCKQCNSGYLLEQGECTEIVCSCQNGQPHTGALCKNNGAESCMTCNQGYHKSGNLCVANVCICENGNAATGAQCPINGAQKCAPIDCDTSDESGDYDSGSECDSGSACNPGYKTRLFSPKIKHSSFL